MSSFLFVARPLPVRARSSARPLARRRNLDFLDNNVRDHSTSASARHHVQRMDARIAELKRALRAAEADRLEALRCCSAEEDEVTCCLLEALLARHDT